VGATEERSLVSQISVSNMTQRLQGTFYISSVTSGKFGDSGSRDRATHTHYPDRTGYRGRACPYPHAANRFIFGNETPSERAGLYGYYQSMVGDLNQPLTTQL